MNINKNFIFKFLSYFIILLAPIFWLLSIIAKDTFGWFNFSVGCGFIFAGLGLIIIAKNSVINRISAYKKLALLLSAIFEVIALICFVFGFALPKNIIAPIICVILATILFISLFIAGGGTKWDEGDNHKEGYKNYYERKEEQKQKEKQAKLETNNNQEENNNKEKIPEENNKTENKE